MSDEVKLDGNLDIKKALEEFETKSDPAALQTGEPTGTSSKEINQSPQGQGSRIKFETDSWSAVKYYKQASTPRIINLVIKHSGGLIKEDTQAYYVVFGLVVLAIATSLFLFFGVSGNSYTPLPPGARVIFTPGMPPRIAEPINLPN